MEKNSITVSAQNFSQGRQEVAAHLKEAGLSVKEITMAQLLMEEMFFRLKKGMEGGRNQSHHAPAPALEHPARRGEDFSADVSLKRAWRETDLRLEVCGREYNPIPSVTEQEDGDEEEAYRLAILKTNRQRLSCVRKNGKNIVTIKLRELNATKKQLIYTVCALILGIVGGLIAQSVLDSAAIAAVNNSFINPVRSLFLNALHMMMAPVTFFAIIAGITNISDAALIGKLGGRMVMVSGFMQLITVLLALFLGIFIFTGDFSYIQAGISSSGGGNAPGQNVSLADMLLNIVPRNLVDPFKGDNILQVMFLAIFFGFIINNMGEKAKGAVEVIDFVFRFVLAVLKLIVKAIPLVVFLSMLSLFAGTGIESLLAFGKLFGGLALGILIVWAVAACAVLLFGKISPIKAIKKLAALSPLIFIVSSSHARLPFVLKFCAEKLGIDGKLAAFSIPVGVQLNKAGNCVFFSLVTIMFMRVYNLEIPAEMFLTLWLSVFVMAIAKPPIPCGGIICIAYLFTVVGVPPEAISVILCIEPLASMFNGVCNESANITTSFIVAKKAGMLDEQKYFA